MKARNKPLVYGILSGIALLMFYFLLMTITSSYSNAVEQFIDMWYLLIILIIGFGIQIGLYTYVKNRHYINNEGKVSVATSTGISTTSMVACCAHHLSDVLPVIGFSVAALFLSKYQYVFIFIGIISNLIGILLMLRMIKKRKFFNENNGILNFILKYNLNFALKIVIVFSAIILPVLIIRLYKGG